MGSPRFVDRSKDAFRVLSSIGRAAHLSLTPKMGPEDKPTTVIHPVGAVLVDQHDEWCVARRYPSTSSMAKLNTPCDTDPALPVRDQRKLVLRTSRGCDSGE